MEDLKQQYKKVMDDHFPDEMTISFGSSNSSIQKEILEDTGFKRSVGRKGA